MNHHIIIMWAEVGIGFAQCGIVGRWLWRYGKYLEKRRLVIDAQAERFAVLGRELDAALASRARRARPAGGSHD